MKTFLIMAAAIGFVACSAATPSAALEIVMKTASVDPNPAPAPAKKPALKRSVQPAKTAQKPKPQ